MRKETSCLFWRTKFFRFLYKSCFKSPTVIFFPFNLHFCIYFLYILNRCRVFPQELNRYLLFPFIFIFACIFCTFSIDNVYYFKNTTITHSFPFIFVFACIFCISSISNVYFLVFLHHDRTKSNGAALQVYILVLLYRWRICFIVSQYNAYLL